MKFKVTLGVTLQAASAEAVELAMREMFGDAAFLDGIVFEGGPVVLPTDSGGPTDLTMHIEEIG